MAHVREELALVLARDLELTALLGDLAERDAESAGAIFDLLLQALRPLRVVQRDGGLTRQHAYEVAVGFAQASERAVDIDVEVA